MARFFCIFALIFILACTDNKKDSMDSDMQNQTWLFNKQYIKAIDSSSWETLNVVALNDYTDFKLEFSYISVGKPKTCGLYAKGIITESFDKNKSNRILIRPNLIPESSIWISKDSDDRLNLQIENITHFIVACGNVHKDANGTYEVRE